MDHVAVLGKFPWYCQVWDMLLPTFPLWEISMHTSCNKPLAISAQPVLCCYWHILHYRCPSTWAVICCCQHFLHQKYSSMPAGICLQQHPVYQHAPNIFIQLCVSQLFQWHVYSFDQILQLAVSTEWGYCHHEGHCVLNLKENKKKKTRHKLTLLSSKWHTDVSCPPRYLGQSWT